MQFIKNIKTCRYLSMYSCIAIITEFKITNKKRQQKITIIKTYIQQKWLPPICVCGGAQFDTQYQFG